MTNELILPLLNPVSFYEINPVELPQYLSHPFEDYPYRYTVKDWEEPVGYCQKYQKSDIINLQFISNFDPVSVAVIDVYDQVLISVNALQKLQNKYSPGSYAYEASISLASLPEGTYFLKISAGGAALLISEPILVKVIHANTLYLQYKNSRYHQEVIFETGIEFNFRVEGSLGHVDPSSRDQYYDDQRFNPTILSSKPFDNFPLVFGGSYGIPDWVIQKINYIFSCNNVRIDGKLYAKTSDTKFSLKEEDQYPLRGMEFTVRPGLNRGYKILNPDLDTNLQLIVVHNIDSRLFGDLSQQAGSNVIAITDLE